MSCYIAIYLDISDRSEPAKEKTAMFHPHSPGAVYPTLQLLEEMAYVTAEQRDAKKVYTITEEGRRFLAEQGQPAESIRRRMRSHWNPESAAEIQETMADIGTLARLIGQHSRTADQDQMRRVRDIVAKARSEIETLLNQQP